MTTFIDQVREMGLKQATVAKADELVERITAGMNVTDIRAALRGDEPRRPNPRLRPHADGFWFHIRPSFYHAEVTHIYPTFRLGWLSTFMFVWETITGIFLMIFYTPSPNVAYADMWNILSNVPLGQLMRNLHRFGAEVMVLVVAAHMLRTYITGSYKKPRQFTWLTGMILLVLTLVLSFSGYLLPWDQLAYWAVTVAVSATSALGSLPIPNAEALATNMDLLVRGAPSIGAGGLLRFYLLHVLALPLLLAIFTFVHYYKVVLHGHSLPPGREAVGEDTAKRVPRNERVYFIPDILTSELMWTALTTLFLVAGSLWFANVPIETHANPQVTPLHVVAPWYLEWSQGWLKWPLETRLFIVAGPSMPSAFWVSFVIIPGLATAFFLWPYLEVGRSRRYGDRHITLALAFFFMAFMLFSNYMGSPKYKVRGSSDQEVSQEIMPQEGHSPVLETPYEELDALLGTRDMAVFYPGEQTTQEHWNHALEEFKHAMDNFACNYGSVTDYRVDCIERELEDGSIAYGNGFADSAMPIATPKPQTLGQKEDYPARIEVSRVTEGLLRIDIVFEVPNPASEDGSLLFESVSTKYRHIDSNYEEY